MKKINYLLLLTLFTFGIKSSFSQTVDSLSVFPNPFATKTTIHFEIAQTDTISVDVFNVLGELKSTYFKDTILSSGSYNINWLAESLPDGLYFVRLGIGSSKSIIKKAIKDGSISSIEVAKANNKFLVYPNPTNDHIEIPLEGNKTITITDTKGKLLKSFSTDQKVISLLDLAAGQYFITIFLNENEKMTSHIIIKRE
jgi:hypothetical protein